MSSFWPNSRNALKICPRKTTRVKTYCGQCEDQSYKVINKIMLSFYVLEQKLHSYDFINYNKATALCIPTITRSIVGLYHENIV